MGCVLMERLMVRSYRPWLYDAVMRRIYIHSAYILDCFLLYVPIKGLSRSIYKSILRRTHHPELEPLADGGWLRDGDIRLDRTNGSQIPLKWYQDRDLMHIVVHRNTLSIGQIINNGSRKHPPNGELTLIWFPPVPKGIPSHYI